MTTITHQVNPIKLEDDEKFNGENWATFEMAMRTEGNTRGPRKLLGEQGSDPWKYPRTIAGHPHQ